MPGKALAAGGGGPTTRKVKRTKPAPDGARGSERERSDALQLEELRKRAVPTGAKPPRRKGAAPPPGAVDRPVKALPADRGDGPPKKRRKRGAAFWDSLPGWKEVEVGDDFLLGAEEGGFAGLEVLDDPAVLEQYMVAGDGNGDGGDGDAAGDLDEQADAGGSGAGAGRADETGGADVAAETGKKSKKDEKNEKSEKRLKKNEKKGKAADVKDAKADAQDGAAAAEEEDAAAAADAGTAEAAAEERRIRQRERLKAKKARRKERRLQRLAAGGGGSGSGADVSDDVDAAVAEDQRPAANAAAKSTKPSKAAKSSAKVAAASVDVTAEDGSEEGFDGDADEVGASDDDDLDELLVDSLDDMDDLDEQDDEVEQDDEEEQDDVDEDEEEMMEEEMEDEEEDKQGRQGQRQQRQPVAAGARSQPGGEAPDMSAWAEFELHPDVVAALATCGFAAPTPIQRECLHPAIRARADIIGAAQTGSGKTLAFGLPILHVLATERAATAAAAVAEGLAEDPAEGEEQVAEEEEEEEAAGTGEESAGGESEEEEEEEEEEQQKEPKSRKRQRRLERLQRHRQQQKQQRQKKQKNGQQSQKQSQGQAQDQAGPRPVPGPLRALILTPTRELALQVGSHLQAVGRRCGVRVAAIVGGISDVKQARLLAARPAVLVATPGRLWDLMCRPPSTDRNGLAAAAHLADLSSLSFLVLDEADRMVAQGHYKELSSILERLPHPSNAREVTEDPEFEELRRAKLKEREGKRTGAERAEQKQQQQQEEGEEEARPLRKRRHSDHGEAADEDEEGDEGAGTEEEEEEEEAEGVDGDGEEDEDSEGEAGGDDAEAADEEEEEAGAPQAEEQEQGQEGGPQGGQTKKRRRGPQMQTFVFSATLTLPLFLKKRLRRGGGGAGGGAATLESLMDRVPFRTSPPPKVVDLTPQRRLADRVVEAAVSCLEDERDEVLYYLLAAHPGRTLVFANAVSAIRRVAALLQALGLPAAALHAQQQQRQRLKSLDRFKARPHSILVATDVAARGLDIQDVATVIHYQLPASADTYIHRCGRTARGLAGDGISIALVTPREAARFSGLARVLGRDLPPAFPVDQSLMPQVRARVRLAIRLDEIERKERKQRAETTWRRSNAKALGLALSDDEEEAAGDSDEEGGGRGGGGGKRLRNGRIARPSAQAEALRQQLAALLAEPLAPRMSSRYFTGGLAAALATRVKEPAGSGGGAAGAKAAAAAAAAPPPRGSEAAAPGAATAAVPKAVALATKLHESRQTAAAAVAAANQRRKAKKLKGAAAAAAAGAKGARGGKGLDARLLVSRNAMKKQRRQGMVVIPQAFGRDAAAPNALEALRSRMAALGSGAAAAAAAAVKIPTAGGKRRGPAAGKKDGRGGKGGGGGNEGGGRGRKAKGRKARR